MTITLVFFSFTSMINRRTHTLSAKTGDKHLELCYSIEEALKESSTLQVSGIMPVRSYRDKISSNKGFQIWWRDASQEKLSAYMNSNREVCFISILSLSCHNGHVRGDHFGKVVHDQVCKDLLEAARHFFCVQSVHTDRKLQITKSRLNPPAQCI